MGDFWNKLRKLSSKEGRYELLSEEVRKIMNDKINRVAEVLDLKIEKGKINLTAQLEGESDCIVIDINYVIQNDYINISKIRTNKKWLDGLAEIFMEKYPKIDLKKHLKNKFLRYIIKTFL